MNSESKLRQQEELLQNQHSTHEQAALEFTSPEELLRHDVTRTEVPSAVAERLNDSLAQEPKPAKSWWRRFVSGA